jgi:hypothetical protein
MRLPAELIIVTAIDVIRLLLTAKRHTGCCAAGGRTRKLVMHESTLVFCLFFGAPLSEECTTLLCLSAAYERQSLTPRDKHYLRQTNIGTQTWQRVAVSFHFLCGT